MDLAVTDHGFLAIPRQALESEVSRRLGGHPPGVPGISLGPSTGDGQAELVMRDRHGNPIGVLGFTGPLITDFAVRQDRRRLGIGTALVRHAMERHGCAAIRGPFSEDGMAFLKKVGGYVGG